MKLPFLRAAFRTTAANSSEFPAPDDPFYTRLFWTWLIARTLIWTAIACLTLSTIPMDTAEMLSWGREWRLGYYKHPPLPAWVAESAAFLAGGSVWGVYLASHIVIGVCFWAVWRLGREMLSPRAAFFAALALEGLVYYNYMANDINHNVLLAGASALTTLCCYRALRSGRNGWWLGLGVAVGFTMLSKYSSGFLLLPMLVFLGLHPACRGWWKRPGPYLALAAAVLIVLPHLVWCFRTGFGPRHYALTRSTEGEHAWINHLWYPAEFALSQLWRLLPVLLILAPLTNWPWFWRLRAVDPTQRFDRDFLLTLVIVPVLMHLLVSLVLGVEVHDLWGFHLWTFVGLVLLFFLDARNTARNFAWAGGLAFVVSVAFMLFTMGQNLLSPTLGFAYKTHFPAQPLARSVQEEWRRRFGLPVPIVASNDYYLGSIMCWYVPGRPAMCMLGDVGETPWALDEDLNSRGGVIVWDAEMNGADLPEDFRRRFPRVVTISPVVVSYRANPGLPPRRFGVALVPPGPA